MLDFKKHGPVRNRPLKSSLERFKGAVVHSRWQLCFPSQGLAASCNLARRQGGPALSLSLSPNEALLLLPSCLCIHLFAFCCTVLNGYLPFHGPQETLQVRPLKKAYSLLLGFIFSPEGTPAGFTLSLLGEQRWWGYTVDAQRLWLGQSVDNFHASTFFCP